VAGTVDRNVAPAWIHRRRRLRSVSKLRLIRADHRCGEISERRVQLDSGVTRPRFGPQATTGEFPNRVRLRTDRRAPINVDCCTGFRDKTRIGVQIESRDRRDGS